LGRSFNEDVLFYPLLFKTLHPLLDFSSSFCLSYFWGLNLFWFFGFLHGTGVASLNQLGFEEKGKDG
jgi:hypothetical protein